MKRLQLILVTTMTFFFLSTSIVFNACTKDPCKDLICKNNGVCRDGRCKCAPGFEGVNCEMKVYEKFIGTWQGTYRCNGSLPAIQTSIIAPGTTGSLISIYNIFSQNDAITASVEGDKILIPEQTVKNIMYKGQGYIEGIYITLFVEEKDNTTGIYSTCVYNATKFVQP